MSGTSIAATASVVAAAPQNVIRTTVRNVLQQIWMVAGRSVTTNAREKEQSLMPQNSEKIQHIDPSTPMRRVMSASSLSSDAVRNRLGEDLGAIKEIMIDVPSGQVAYAVLSFGGFLGIGQKLFAIPWAALTLDEDRKCFMLDVDKSTLEKAPGFDKDHWPDMAEPTWGREIHQYYGREPYWEQSSAGLDDNTR
jgi:sporulation protein YlmC with PRC-barrel domain